MFLSMQFDQIWCQYTDVDVQNGDDNISEGSYVGVTMFLTDESRFRLRRDDGRQRYYRLRGERYMEHCV